MDEGASFVFGEPPEEPGEPDESGGGAPLDASFDAPLDAPFDVPMDHGPEPSDDIGEHGLPDGALKGWIPPEDRLWLHPSEISRSATAARTSVAPRNRHPIAAGVVGVAVVTAVMAASVALLSDTDHKVVVEGIRGSALPAPTTLAVSKSSTAALAERMQPSMALIVVGRGTLARTGTGLVMPDGAHIITSTALVSATAAPTITIDGKTRVATVVGSDLPAGVTVIDTTGGLRGATYQDKTTAPGAWLMTTCIEASADPDATPGQVDGVGSDPSPFDTPQLVDTISVADTQTATPGAALVTNNGDVVAMLERTYAVKDDTVGVYVPAWLALGAAQRIIAGQSAAHGWLGVRGADGPSGGAYVVSVPPTGAAARSGLAPGDTVVDVDAQPVMTMADLQGRLYLQSPGARVSLTVMRRGQRLTISVTLSSSPG